MEQKNIKQILVTCDENGLPVKATVAFIRKVTDDDTGEKSETLDSKEFDFPDVLEFLVPEYKDNAAIVKDNKKLGKENKSLQAELDAKTAKIEKLRLLASK